MKCPHDGTELQMTERQTIEIDYCPTCRGVWLDRGELDKIIERSHQEIPRTQVAPTTTNSYQTNEPYHGKRKRREGFLEDLFDF